MSGGAMIEAGIGLALIVIGILIYRRGGNQGAVILFVIAAILLIHGLGLLEYHPSQAELER